MKLEHNPTVNKNGGKMTLASCTVNRVCLSGKNVHLGPRQIPYCQPGPKN